ncbi:MAG: sugar ABC transporter ATP-binding protein [Planctomycetes bacterium]|nr:sugar ABC transporter ATP-binding protein [Planctomycetota bacterium]
MPERMLELRGISKRFPGVMALDGVSLEVAAGTVHAIVGENGAGKSTLMKILMGLYPQYEGEIRLQGRKIDHQSVKQALDVGISMIHQELTYVPEMTVAENIFLGKEPTHRPFKWIKRAELLQETETLLRRTGIGLDPTRRMRDLSVAERQMVEIAKAISYDAKVIIMDEPTSALSDREVQRLFSLVTDIKASGSTVLYITHKLDEVFQLADEVTVLRDGHLIDTCRIEETDADRLVAMMVGRQLKDIFPKRTQYPGPEILAVKHLSRRGVFQDVSFTLRRGEVLGIAGLMAAGRTEVVRCLFGLDPYDQGRIYIKDQEVTIKSPADAIRLGMGFVSEDRAITGLIPCLSIRKNITLSNLNRCTFGPVIVKNRERQLADRAIADLSIKTINAEQRVSTLSGGNQQKVVLGKALLSQPDILILDEPTRGIDIGAKSEVYKLIRALADEGKAIIMVSSELEEILGMSDRIIVLHQGKITGRLRQEEASQEKIMKYALGSTRQ